MSNSLSSIEMITLHEKDPDKHTGAIIALIVIVLLLLATAKCQAQQVKIDTMICKVECIKKIVSQPSSNGKSTKCFAVYNDPKIGFSEIIPISKSVMEYIDMCKRYSVAPTLGIKLRNGVISSIIRYKVKFVEK